MSYTVVQYKRVQIQTNYYQANALVLISKLVIVSLIDTVSSFYLLIFQ